MKMNLDTDLQYAFSHAIEEHFEHRRGVEADGVDKRLYDPRAWGRKAEEAMAGRVVEACAVVGSRGRSLARAAASEFA
jgi:fructose-bisphosphate aldolase class II